MRKSQFYTAQLFYLLLFTQFVGMMRQKGMTKYVIFMLFLLPLLLFGTQKIRRRSAFLLIPSLTYITLGLVSCAASCFFDFFSIKNAILLVFPSVFAVVLYEKGPTEGIDLCRTIFACYVLYSILFSYTFQIAESTRAFPFGAFVIYFFLKKDWSFFTLAAAFCYFTDKRIALLGVIVTLFLVIFALLIIKKRSIKTRHLWIVGTVTGVAAAYLIAGMTHTGKLIELFGKIGFDPTGRQTIWKAARQFGSFDVFFTGNGLGFVTSELNEIKVWMRETYWFTNLHSDFYTGFLELGFLGFGVWILSYFWSFNKLTEDWDDNNRIAIFALAVIAYTFILFITDNALIYFEYWFPVNLMMLDMAYSRTVDIKRQSLFLKAQNLYE